MGSKQWVPAVVHCRPGQVTGAETAAAHVAGEVRVTGRWVRIRTGHGEAETWISAAAVQRIVWGEAPPDD
ncbi:hypothetical protein [Streptomyces sp. CB01881]|uniref:hypothetical protein n=1 Tax=Streptomyces sp. CB01881 TaxID=2078691 RepID=UPI0011E025B4|nr:hypothetical protein [Streptomyces sp. CB01881]TYC76253.1 hypothetical protein EH183_00970 [Streptomyces sp. CB01881]